MCGRRKRYTFDASRWGYEVEDRTKREKAIRENIDGEREKKR